MLKGKLLVIVMYWMDRDLKKGNRWFSIVLREFETEEALERHSILCEKAKTQKPTQKTRYNENSFISILFMFMILIKIVDFNNILKSNKQQQKTKYFLSSFHSLASFTLHVPVINCYVVTCAAFYVFIKTRESNEIRN